MQKKLRHAKNSWSVQMTAQISAKHISVAQKIVNTQVKVMFAKNKSNFDKIAKLIRVTRKD